MFLTRLRLENIRCFKDITIDFSDARGAARKWTVLLGENGTGKSTVLRAIALISCGSDGLAELVSQPGYWVRWGAERGRIEAEFVTADGEARELSLEIGADERVSHIISRSIESLAPLNAALEHTQRNYFVAGYGVSRRLSGQDSLRAQTSRFKNIRAQSVATLFDADATLNPLESWAMDLDYRKSQQGVETVRKVLSDFLPGLTFDSIDRDSGRLLFKTSDGIVPLQYLSDGYQNVAAWIGDLLYRITETFDDYKSPLHIRGLLIVDEIDLHLHPKWQRSLLSFLNKKLPNMQIVVTTHSVVTAQQSPENSLFYLSRKGKSVELEEFGTDPGALLINQLLMTEAFGLESDESLEVEKRKAEYRKLRDKKKRSQRDEAKLEKLTSELRTIPSAGRSNMMLEKEQMELLRKVEKAIGKLDT